MANSYKIYVSSVESPLFEFSNDNIESLIFENAVDVIGNELSTDIIEFSVFFDDTDSTLRTLPYGTPLFFYNNGNYAGKYYSTKVERTAPQKFMIHGTSLIGLISKEQFYGGFYERARFDDVLYEILFSNGPVYDKGTIYKPEAIPTINPSSLGASRGANIGNGTSSASNRKQRLQIGFTIGDGAWYTNDTSLGRVTSIAGQWYGGTRYSVLLHQYRASVGAPTYFSVDVVYNSVTYSVGTDTPLIGKGSYVTVDIYPAGGTLDINVDYVKYDDPTTTGQLSRSETITELPSSASIYLGVAFGSSSGTYTWDYDMNVIWDYYRVYHADGSPYIDAIYIETAMGKRYALNKVSGVYAVCETRMYTNGSALGFVADYTNYLQSEKLLDSIEIEDSVASGMINGWLPVTTRRDALHHLLFAQNVSLIKTANDKLLFTGLNSNTVGSLTSDEVYNDNTEELIAEARKISVTEHTFVIPSSDPVDVFDNSSAPAISGDYIATFNNAPIYGTPTATGLTIKSFNCNCAVVSGRGKITGTPYIHAQNEILYQNDSAYDGADVSVSDVALITATNSDGVMDKLKAYYCASVKKINLGTLYREQRCGTKYSFPTIFDANESGHLSKLSAKSSSFIKADCEFISGYTPPSSNGYGSFQIVEHDGDWTVPQAVREQEYPNIRLIIIGNGHDGTNGGNGYSGDSVSTGSGVKPGGDGGSGGAAGLGGSGGDIYQITIDVANVNKIVATKSGYNTVVKTYDDNDSVISTYNSSSGNPSDVGVTNMFTGSIYARKGKDGRAGGNGGKGYSYGQQNIGTDGGDVVVPYQNEPFKGGSYHAANFGTYVYEVYDSLTSYISYTSGGGGAADGNNGGDAYLTGRSGKKYYTHGGNGANAIQQFDVYTEYGSGGWGGNGGGGGGGAGTIIQQYFNGSAIVESTINSQTPGAGGTGSAGTPGIDGCLLIYY